MTKKQKPPDYQIWTAALQHGQIVMHADSEENARPWVRMLERAGVKMDRTPNGGYLFTFDDKPDLTGKAQRSGPAGPYSPGPWRLDGGQLRDADGNSIASFPYTLAGREDVANAQLVQAAPLLAEALHFMAAAVRTRHDPLVIEELGILDAALEALRAAGWDPDKGRPCPYERKPAGWLFAELGKAEEGEGQP